jgi:hypothetical protein
LSGKYVDIISKHQNNANHPGLSFCEVNVFGHNSVAGYVKISTENSNGIVVADAIKYEPMASSMRSTCGDDSLASLTFLNLPASGVVTGSIGDEITINVEARDSNPLQM